VGQAMQIVEGDEASKKFHASDNRSR